MGRPPNEGPMSPSPPPAAARFDPRLAACRVLVALDKTPRHLETLLARELGRWPSADPRQRAAAFNLVYTVLRNRLWLDHQLGPLVKRGLPRLDPPVRAVLRLGAAELLLLDKPAHAAVSCAVDLARAAQAHAAAGLVNGVLRSLARRPQPLALPDRQKKPAAHLGVGYSHPPWLVAQLLEDWPADQVEAWLAANQEPAPGMIRVNTLLASVPEVSSLLASRVGSITPHAWVPQVLVLKGFSGPLEELPGFAQGLWQGQDAGAAAISLLLGVQPGMRVLDMCAGAGGKSGHLAELMHDQGELWALDESSGRVEALKANLARLGITRARVAQADARRLSPEKEGFFDRILLDAPCTGLGVAGRRPDLRWRREPEDPPRLARLQLTLARAAARVLAPGGALLFCTCSVSRAENQEVVAALLAQAPDLALQWDAKTDPALTRLVGTDGFFRTFPQPRGCDSFFAARLVKKGPPPQGAQP